jgi:hypothetical protein
MSSKKKASIVVGIVATCALGYSFYVGWVGGNFRVVSEGKAYRCAQLDPDLLEQVILQHRIKVVVNLRGGRIGEPFHDFEVEEAHEAGARVVDVPLSATKLPPPQELSKLVHLFETDPGPFLIHCHGGADRSGLASAVFRIVVDEIPADKAAAEQLTWRYGHLSWGEAKPMNDFFDLYMQNSRGMKFADWADEVYPQLYDASK